jgi:hypothetical protein
MLNNHQQGEINFLSDVFFFAAFVFFVVKGLLPG